MDITPDAIQPDAIQPDAEPAAPVSSVAEPITIDAIQPDSIQPSVSAPTGRTITTRHKYDSQIQRGAASQGQKSSLLRAMAMQETGLGSSSNYNESTGLDRDGNQGHGLFQLDPASGAKQDVLDRAAKDPEFAARYAAGMMKKNLEKTNGNLRQALSMYNTGSPTSPVGLKYADSVLKYQQELDPENLNPEWQQKLEHDFKKVQHALKNKKDIGRALAGTQTLKGIKKAEAQGNISADWVKEHPVEAAMNVLGAPQRMVGGLFHEIANDDKADVATKVSKAWDMVWHPTEKAQKDSTAGVAELINKGGKKAGHKGNIIPTHDEIDKYITDRHWGAMEPYAKALAKGGEDFILQTASDPTSILSLGAHAAIGTAGAIARSSGALLKAQGVGQHFAHLTKMDKAAEKVQDLLVARRDLDKAGFTKEGKQIRLSVENAALAKKTRAEQADVKILKDPAQATRRYLEYVAQHGDKNSAAQAARALGQAPVKSTGWYAPGNLQAKLNDITAMSEKERAKLFGGVRDLIADKSVLKETLKHVSSDPSLFKGVPATIHTLGFSDKAKFLKSLDTISEKNPLGKLAKNSIMWNPAPHGLKNVGTLAYLAGGLPAVTHGIASMLKPGGVPKATLDRLESMGAMPLYIDHATNKYSQAMNSAMERMEQGWRSGLLQTLDKKMGVGKPGSKLEMLKGNMISEKIGDYRNQSALVKMFQALGGPFVAFRLGIVPQAVGSALKNDPQRVTNILRADQDLQNNRSKKQRTQNRVVLGGPVEDALKLATNTTGFLTSASTEGALIAGQKTANKIAQKGVLGNLIDLGSTYIPGFSTASELAKAAQGNSMPGTKRSMKMSWVDQMAAAIAAVGGGHVETIETRHQEAVKNRKIKKSQGI